jgi:HAD superfamily hydrolase (TIGR01509 family)
MLIASWSAAFAGNAPAVSIEMCVCLPDSNCDRRKPMPGMLHALLRRHRVPPQRALYIGDLAIDALAAERAGMRFQFAQRFFEPNSAPTDSP